MISKEIRNLYVKPQSHPEYVYCDTHFHRIKGGEWASFISYLLLLYIVLFKAIVYFTKNDVVLRNYR